MTTSAEDRAVVASHPDYQRLSQAHWSHLAQQKSRGSEAADLETTPGTTPGIEALLGSAGKLGRVWEEVKSKGQLLGDNDEMIIRTRPR